MTWYFIVYLSGRLIVMAQTPDEATCQVMQEGYAQAIREDGASIPTTTSCEWRTSAPVLGEQESML